MRLPLIFAPLRHRDFRLLWIGQTISTFGNFVYQVAVPFQLLALGATPVQLGIGAALSAGVSLVLFLFGGALVDRLPRRRIILASDLLSGVVVTSIAVLGWTGLLRIEHIYVEAAFFGLTSAFFFPAMGAIIPELVPADILLQGNTLRSLSRQIARLAGPVTGGLLVVFAGPPTAFFVDGLTFFAGFVALAAARPPAAVTVVRAHLLREIRDGFAFTFSLPWLWITIFLFALVNAAFVGAIVVALPLLVRDVLHADARMFGLIEALTGVGEIAGAILLGQLRIVRIGVVMFLSAVLDGLTLAVFGLTDLVPIVLVAAAIGGIGITGFGVLWETALQQHVPRHLLGRVTSVDYFGGTLLGPVAPLVAGLLVTANGSSFVFVLAGSSIAVLCLGALLVPSIRQLRNGTSDSSEERLRRDEGVRQP